MTNMLEGSNLFNTLSEYNQNLFNNWVSKAEFHFVGVKTTVCLLTISNGFEIVGTSACVDPVMFDEALGKQYALVDALHRLDELAGFAMQIELASEQ